MSTKYERTAVPYPTDGPGDGRSWRDYFRDAKSGSTGGVGSGDDGDSMEQPSILDSGYQRVVTYDSGREWWASRDGLPAPGPAAGYLRLLLAEGWVTVVGHAHSFQDGGHYGDSAAKAGERKPDFDIVSHSVEGYKKGKGRVRIVYQSRASERGGEYGAATCVLRRATGIGPDQVSDKEFKAWISS